MADNTPRSLRDYASFELERRGYDRAQVDAFLGELDQAFRELEAAVKERGNEVAALQREVEQLRRESPKGRADEILRRAEENAEQMLASSITEGQEIIANAETMAMRIIANARAQSQELASQPAGFGMLQRVRTIAADIDRIKAEHAALLGDETELVDSEPAPTAKIPEGEEAAIAQDVADADDGAATDDEPAADDALVLGHPGSPAKPRLAPVDLDEPPRIQLVEPLPDEDDEDDEADDLETAPVSAKTFDWGAARQEVLSALDDEDGGDSETDDIDAPAPEVEAAVPDDELPTIMRRQGSRYERHSASLPKKEKTDGESTLANVSKVSRGRRRRASMREDSEN